MLRNRRSSPTYEVLAEGVSAPHYTDTSVDFTREDYVTYKIVAVGSAGRESPGVLHTCSRATQLETDRYALQAFQINGQHIDPKDLD